MKPKKFKRMVNLWPPFFFSGISLTEVAEDYSFIKVKLKKGKFNQNYFGTQFGGHLFKMCDPFWAFLAHKNLGKDYVVWDQAGSIEFKAQGRTDVFAEFHFTPALKEQLVAGALEASAQNKGFRMWLTNNVSTKDGELIAVVKKQLYVKKQTRSA